MIEPAHSPGEPGGFRQLVGVELSISGLYKVLLRSEYINKLSSSYPTRRAGKALLISAHSGNDAFDLSSEHQLLREEGLSDF